MILKCLVCNSVQRNSIDFLRSGLRMRQSCAKFGINLLMKCTDSRKDLKSLNVDGGGMAKIAGVLFSSGDMPVCVNLKPSRSICVSTI